MIFMVNQKIRKTKGKCSVCSLRATTGEPTLTYSLALSIARDAATCHMRSAGRTCWALADYNVAVETFEKLWPMKQEPGDPK